MAQRERESILWRHRRGGGGGGVSETDRHCDRSESSFLRIYIIWPEKSQQTENENNRTNSQVTIKPNTGSEEGKTSSTGSKESKSSNTGNEEKREWRKKEVKGWRRRGWWLSDTYLSCWGRSWAGRWGWSWAPRTAPCWWGWNTHSFRSSDTPSTCLALEDCLDCQNKQIPGKEGVSHVRTNRFLVRHGFQVSEQFLERNRFCVSE